MNNFLKCVFLLGATICSFNGLNDNKKNSADFDVLPETIQESFAENDLLKKHDSNSLVLTLTNAFSKKIVSNEINFDVFLKEKDISISESFCLSSSLLNSDFEKQGTEAHLQFLIKLKEGNDESLVNNANKLLKTKNFNFITPDYFESACSGSFSSSDFNRDYNSDLDSHNILPAWEIAGYGSRSTRIGIIDSYLMSHVDLNIDRGLSRNFIGSRLTNYQDEHGLVVAGVAAANGLGNSNYDHKKFVGVCPNNTLVSLCITNDASIGGKISDVISAIDYANTLWDTSNRISVLNFSYSGYCEDDSLLTAIKTFPGVFVWAAGNENKDISMDRCYYDCPNLISVGALTKSDKILSESNHGSGVNIYARGENVRTTSHDDMHLTSGGTSISAPFVTGTAALIYSAYPGITARLVKKAIMLSYDSVANSYGLVKKLNIGDAVSYAKNYYNSARNSNNPIQIEVLEDSLFYTKYLVSNLSDRKINLAYKGSTCTDSEISSLSYKAGDRYIDIPANSGKIITIGKKNSNTTISVMFLDKNKKIQVTYSKGNSATSSNYTNSEGTFYRTYTEKQSTYNYTKEYEKCVFSDSQVQPLTFDVTSSSGFIIKSWKIKVKNNMGSEIKIRYNKKMCFMNDALSWDGLRDINNSTISANSSIELDIAGNGTAGSIALAVYYIDSVYGFSKLKITGADQIKKNSTPRYYNNTIIL